MSNNFTKQLSCFYITAICVKNRIKNRSNTKEKDTEKLRNKEARRRIKLL